MTLYMQGAVCSISVTMFVAMLLPSCQLRAITCSEW